jgi:hypothetical protein
MGGVIMLRKIVISFISRAISNRTFFTIFVELRKTKIVFSARWKGMDEANRTISSETKFSTNMENLSMSEKEKLIAQILASKFHTDPAT